MILPKINTKNNNLIESKENIYNENLNNFIDDNYNSKKFFYSKNSFKINKEKEKEYFDNNKTFISNDKLDKLSSNASQINILQQTRSTKELAYISMSINNNNNDKIELERIPSRNNKIKSENKVKNFMTNTIEKLKEIQDLNNINNEYNKQKNFLPIFETKKEDLTDKEKDENATLNTEVYDNSYEMDNNRFNSVEKTPDLKTSSKFKTAIKGKIKESNIFNSTRKIEKTNFISKKTKNNLFNSPSIEKNPQKFSSSQKLKVEKDLNIEEEKNDNRNKFNGNKEKAFLVFKKFKILKFFNF